MDQSQYLVITDHILKSNHDFVSWLLSERDNDQANNEVELRYHGLSLNVH